MLQQLHELFPGELIEAEHRFHDTRKWRFDWCLLRLKLAIEREGGVWSGGRHTRGAGFLGDCRKYSEAQVLGWTVFRFPTQMIESGEAADVLRRWKDRSARFTAEGVRRRTHG